ncbi:hypothetical protein [Alkalicoccobacillus murimartini]|uniref:Uncharacterized protein n=1 Tax=Alkalicoccobacillus murimartini TaxID=171685 RepID=A0ABT9YFZ7_9BACI|nr:hypothetical protein [Alkalicoccobacillus murimartini]MDQ0206634.1 hypothetical protein [Alkalicoccobacillus murimartini]
MVKDIKDILNFVKEEDNFDASSFEVGIEQEAQSQYPTITVVDPVNDSETNEFEL